MEDRLSLAGITSAEDPAFIARIPPPVRYWDLEYNSMCTFEVPLQRYIPEIHGGGLCCFTLSPRIKSAGAMRALLHASEAPSQAIHAFSVTTITKFRFLLRPVGSIAYSHSSSLSSLRNSLKHGRRLNSSAAGLYKLFIDPPSYQKAGPIIFYTN